MKPVTNLVLYKVYGLYKNDPTAPKHHYARRNLASGDTINRKININTREIWV